MSLLTDGVDDQLAVTIPAASGGSGINITFGTLLIVCRILQGNGSWMSFLELETSGGVSRGGFGRHSNNSIYMAYASSLSENGSGRDIGSSQNWAVYAATKATGTVAPNLIDCPVGGSVGANAGTTSIGNLGDASGGNARIGGNDDFANMRVAVVAGFQGIVLTTTDVQSIADTKTTAAINALGATWLADDSNGFAAPLVGPGTITKTGTADDADDPAGWVYGLGGTPTGPPFGRRDRAMGALMQSCEKVGNVLVPRKRIYRPGIVVPRAV